MQEGIQRVIQEAAHVQEGNNNSLYCTNRTSLENLFYANGYSIYTGGHGSYWNIIESNGKSWKGMEGRGTL